MADTPWRYLSSPCSPHASLPYHWNLYWASFNRQEAKLWPMHFWVQLSQSIRTMLLERYKCRVSSSHSGTAMLTSHTTLYNVRASCWGLAFRQHTVLFLFSSGGCCSCFVLGSVPFPQVWGFQKLVNLLTFPHLTLWVSLCAILTSSLVLDILFS